MKNLWENDLIQFSRLLAEINAIGLTREQYEELSASMDLEIESINELFDRAINAWNEYKKN